MNDSTFKTGNQGPNGGEFPSVADQLIFTDEKFIWRFSPNQSDPRLLEEIFVGREDLLRNIFEKVVESATTRSRHHLLLHGPRGIGKTHLLSLLRHRLTVDEAIHNRLRIAWLNEDETTTSLVQLLVRIYRALCEAYPDEFSAAWLDDLLGQPPKAVTESLTRRLVAHFKARTLVILVENLNLLLESLGLQGQQALRTFLQEYPLACLVATSQQLFHAVTERAEPFFGFFQPMPLKPLSLSDAHQLLLNIARSKGQNELTAFLNTPDGRARVRAIHHLTGGNHRVYIVLSGFITTRESFDQLVTMFQKMADDLTPYYQERLRWISPQQRQIVELLCRERGTVTPKTIARWLLVSENTIGSQVRKLVEIGYLTATRRGRESFYELSEPLMRLVYEVKQQSLLVMLIDFLRIWYRPEQLKELRGSGVSLAARRYLEAAIERTRTHLDSLLSVYKEEIKRAKEEGRTGEIAGLWEERAAVNDEGGPWLVAGFSYRAFNNNPAAALACFDKASELEPDAADIWIEKGTLLDDIGRHEEALRCHDMALDIDPSYALPQFNRSRSLFAINRWDEGFASIRRGLQITEGSIEPLGNTASMFALLFKLSEDDALLQSRISTLVDIYQQAVDQQKEAPTSSRPVNPLTWLGDGLVKSLAKIEADRVTPQVLESYVAAVERCAGAIPQFDVPLRLFRYGIRHLIAKDQAVFAELVEPERQILRQALGLTDDSLM